MLSALILVMVVAACNVQPIYSSQDHPVPAASKGLNLAQLEGRIIEAAQAKGWRIDRVGPGDLRATLKWRGHVAVTRIVFNEQTYRVRHESSQKLKESDSEIHRAYNRRVLALEDEIEKRLYRTS
jgi:hypothetical protein